MGHDKIEASNRDWKPPTAACVTTSLPSQSVAQQQPGRLESLSACLFALAAWDGGWLRLVPAGEGKLVYLKWKWTSGRLSNRYVMVVGEPADIPELLGLLKQKIEAAEEGRGRTSEDRYHNS